jgi:GDP/UDP-N,N'-diacetylbacillosamine 2-epimerase (hydrolysing)
MRRTLCTAAERKSLDISVCVTGQHLSPLFGQTIDDIIETGLRICGRVPVDLDASSGPSMARAIGQELIGITDVLTRSRPDLVLVLGDRGEMLAGALAAIHLNIPVAQLHAGERSGTVDEPVRHAISKLAHYHFVSTDGARTRLIRMGETPEKVFVTGAPGLDGLQELVRSSRTELCTEVGFDSRGNIALVLFHAVLQQAEEAGKQIRQIMDAVCELGVQALCLMPNSDAGGQFIRDGLNAYARRTGVCLRTHLARSEFVSWMAAADVMVGNSSSGIIEAASLGLPVVNVGERQSGRERSPNVTDVPPDRDAVRDAIENALKTGRLFGVNVYGDGRAGDRIIGLLESVPLSRMILMKSNTY